MEFKSLRANNFQIKIDHFIIFNKVGNNSQTKKDLRRTSN